MTKSKIQIKDLKNYEGQEVSFPGWVSSVRDLKHVQFITLRDKSGLVQVVTEKDNPELNDQISALPSESTVNVRGRIVSNDKVNLNGYEVILDGLEVTSTPVGPMPIDANSAIDKRLDWRHVDLRRSENQLIMNIQTTVEAGMREYWLENDFVEMHSPKLVEGASESGAELFQLDYFGKQASLAQSPQFYKQMAMASGLEKVFEIGPVFRANSSFTSRHDTEFTSVDTEFSWIDSHEDLMEFEESWIKHFLGKVYDEHGASIKDTFGREVVVPDTPFPKYTMKEAKEIIRSEFGYEVPREVKGDMDPQSERYIAQYVKEQHGHEFVFVTEFPWSARPFYHMKKEGTDDITKSFDLIWNGLEVTTGAQREHRYDRLEAQIEEKGADKNSLGSYVDFFKYGCPPHGGFGFGLTRGLMNITGKKNVRDVTYVYRGPTRLTP